MSVVQDLFVQAVACFERIDKSLDDIELKISVAEASVDEWTLRQPNEFRKAAVEIRKCLDEIGELHSKRGDSESFSKLQAQLLTIDDLQRAVSAFEQFVSKWVR